MTKEAFISSGLLELYALGISSPEEKLLVEEHLVQFPELTDALNDIENSLESYAQANAVQPSPEAKEKLMNRIFPQEQKVENTQAPVVFINEKNRSISLYKFVAAASIILLLGSIVLNYVYYRKYNKATDDLQVAQQKIEQTDASNEAMSKDLGIVTDRYARPVVLNGTANSPDAVAKIFWMKNTGQVYVDPTNLPKVPEGKQYQLWAIVDGKPVDAGLIATEKGTYHIQKMKSFGKAEAFAITLEKEGGSPAPTMSEMVVISKM